MSAETVGRRDNHLLDPAVCWLRSRQELRELNYWLTFVAYDITDESFSNRIYLIYLVLFFSAWGFVTLTFFASGGETLLRLLNAPNPAAAATSLAMSVLVAWNLARLFGVLRRCPVEFSEEDSYLLCQTPVSRRAVVLRWLWLPWIKSALPFWALAVMLGFSLGEIVLPQMEITARIVAYSGYGLRSWLVLAPVHLALFALHWTVGMLRLRLEVYRSGMWAGWLAALLLCLGLVFPVILWQALAWFEQTGLGFALVLGIGAAILNLVVLAAATERFSLALAAEETRAHVLLNDALRYGLTEYAQTLRTQERLRGEQSPARLAGRPGPAALIWKDLLQSVRGLQWSDLGRWLSLASVAFGAFALPDRGSLLLLTLWVVQVGKLVVSRLRSDLACWAVFRQLPISSQRALILDLAPALTGVVLVSLIAAAGGVTLRGTLAGGVTGGLPTVPGNELVGALPLATVLLIPGAAAAVAGMAALDVVRRAQSALLLNGQAPDVDFFGVITGLVAAGLPVLVITLLPHAVGLGLSIGLSLLIGALALWFAGRARPA